MTVRSRTALYLLAASVLSARPSAALGQEVLPAPADTVVAVPKAPGPRVESLAKQRWGAFGRATVGSVLGSWLGGLFGVGLGHLNSSKGGFAVGGAVGSTLFVGQDADHDAALTAGVLTGAIGAWYIYDQAYAPISEGRFLLELATFHVLQGAVVALAAVR